MEIGWLPYGQLGSTGYMSAATVQGFLSDRGCPQWVALGNESVNQVLFSEIRDQLRQLSLPTLCWT